MEVGDIAMWRLSQNLVICSIFSWGPLLTTILWGTPNLQITFSHKNFSTLLSVMLATTSASTHFMKYSQATMANLVDVLIGLSRLHDPSAETRCGMSCRGWVS